jgi:tryptophanyl-tRNA synthetase
VKFNEIYGEVFKVPEADIRKEVATVVGLDGQKMSKSFGNTLEIFSEEKILRRKIMGIVTDSTPVEAPKNPDQSTIVELYRVFAPADQVTRMENEFRAGGVGYGEFKKRLFEAVWETFAPMRKRRAELESNPDYVDQVLANGAARARQVAEKTMARVRKAVGLRGA